MKRLLCWLVGHATATRREWMPLEQWMPMEQVCTVTFCTRCAQELDYDYPDIYPDSIP